MKLFICLIICLCAGQSFADYIIFEDNFDSYSPGLNWAGSTNWTITDGTVDIIGDGSSWPYYPTGHGLYVDLDGSTSTSGTMLSLALNLTEGTSYKLSYELAGNHVPLDGYLSDDVDVVLLQGNTVINTTHYTLLKNDSFQEYTYTFTAIDSDNYYLKFIQYGNDNVGALLDNVKMAVVPVPATILLGLLGLGIGGWKLRKSM